MNSKDLMGRKTLIVGPVKSGKTKLLSKIIKDLLKLGLKNDIIVLDFSPSKLPGIGGPLNQYLHINDINYIHPNGIRAPRLEGKDSDEVIRFAENNCRLLDKYIDIALDSKHKIIIINDIIIYLHRGSLEKIVKLIKKSDTFIATAYYGSDFDDKGSKLNKREMMIVEKLMDIVDEVIRLGD